MVLQILFLTALFSFVLSEDPIFVPPLKPECRRNSTCGNISVPYPFGLNSSACFKNTSFELFCDHSTTPPSLILGRNIPISNISVENATAIVEVDVATNCYNGTGEPDTFNQSVGMGDSPFWFSNTQNRYKVIGCDTLGYISDRRGNVFTTGCLSTCDATIKIEDPQNLPAEVASCSGIGCCQTEIPKGLWNLNYSLTTPNNHTGLLDTNPCDFGFLTGLKLDLKYRDQVWYSQIVVDWTIGNLTCEQAGDAKICGLNTDCNNATNGDGYRCTCKQGYQGNPYINCTDIDECLPENRDKYHCQGTCKNTGGNYTCECPFGKQGDGKIGCRIRTVTTIGLAIGAGALLSIFVLFLSWIHKRRNQEKNHRRNGGLYLDQLSVKGFKETQLAKATNNFDDKRLLGEGGNGGVYRGSLSDTSEIAVKKAKVANQNQIEQFLNEADIVSKINHKNVVKLLGVCLESKVPMLVYELVSNGTLSQHIHGMNSRVLDSWRNCLKIAAETARALDYMHSLAHPPIIHRDIKSSNILLDETYTAKVADFGASRLIRLDRTMAPTEGQGTMGYLDPEYLQTGELTTKSDVYGFGVVLMELISKQKPLSRGINGEMISLVKVFTLAVESSQLYQVLRVAEATESETAQIHLVAKLAIQCVAMPGTHRPTMSEVADVLNGLSKEYRSFAVEGSGGDEVVSLLDDQEIMTTSVHFELE